MGVLMVDRLNIIYRISKNHYCVSGISTQEYNEFIILNTTLKLVRFKRQYLGANMAGKIKDNRFLL